MATARDVYMAANLLMKQHGIDATIFAAMNADHLADKGDYEGEALWLRVINAIKDLERRRPVKGETVQ